MAPKHGLGRGLDVLIRDGTGKGAASHHPIPLTPPGTTAPNRGAMKVPIQKIRRNTLQPRKAFDDEGLAELSASIKERGVLMPLIVRTSGDGYELIAGERRLRAATAAGLHEVPVTILEVQDADSLLIALIENLQREDLNPLEESEGYQQLAERFQLTQEQIADRVGKARASVANALRLLSLPVEVRNMVASGQLKSGHAKALLGLEKEEDRFLYARRAVNEDLSVRALERLVQRAHQSRKPRAFRTDIPREHLNFIVDKLHQRLSTSVRLTPCRTFANGKKGKGVLEVDFFSNEDLDRLLTLLGITME